MWTSKYFKEVIPSQQRFIKFYNETNITAAEQSFCIKHFNQTYNKVEKVLDKHYGFRVPVVETKEHTLVLYGILSS
jgi:hypothetical protein